jgi:tetratricopeptide (TPR) repeat protein
MKTFIKEKLWPFLAGLGSAGVMLLAFFIPSVQDQWDRHESRNIINQYEQLGNDFYAEEKYDMAEQAYQKAFELSESRRLDLEIKRLQAKISRINMNPKWGTAPPDDLQEIDFQYVLHLQKEKKQAKDRVVTLNSYGIYLVGSGRLDDAESAFKEAKETDSTDVLAYVNLGNLYDQKKEKARAEQFYLKAISIDKTNVRAHYNLGLLYAEQEKWASAKNEFYIALTADPSDKEIKAQYDIAMQQLENQ